MTTRRRRTKTNNAADPWYADGLQFECQADCGACCTNHDDYAYVYIQSAEAERLAEFLGHELEEFLERYAAVDGDELVLRMDQPNCPFLDGSSCTVYPVRPVQCSTFPFWVENLSSRRAWRRLARFCPGIDQGETVDLLKIRDELASRES
jgi:Fe-S-cluster containining protein